MAGPSETHMTERLKEFDLPTLVIHGGDDQIVPVETTGRAASKVLPSAEMIEYTGGPHGITDPRRDQLNKALLESLKARHGEAERQ